MEEEDCTRTSDSDIPEDSAVVEQPEPKPAIRFSSDQRRVIDLVAIGFKGIFFTGRAGGGAGPYGVVASGF